jgi:hypothetical protein
MEIGSDCGRFFVTLFNVRALTSLAGGRGPNLRFGVRVDGG